jgi:hypothetical protein
MEGGKTYHQITEDICSPTEKTPNVLPGCWRSLYRCIIGILRILCCLDRLARYRVLEPEPDHWLGLGYYQLRLVGGYWSRRNLDLRDPFAVPSEMADRGKPGSGGDDHLSP